MERFQLNQRLCILDAIAPELHNFIKEDCEGVGGRMVGNTKKQINKPHPKMTWKQYLKKLRKSRKHQIKLLNMIKYQVRFLIKRWLQKGDQESLLGRSNVRIVSGVFAGHHKETRQKKRIGLHIVREGNYRNLSEIVQEQK